MAANTRIYYATQKVTVRACDKETQAVRGAVFNPKGIQSIGISTNFALEQLFQLGQLEIYDNVENVPEVEVTMQKVADGTAFLYPMIMGDGSIAGADDKEIGTLAANRAQVTLEVFGDNTVYQYGSGGTAMGTIVCSGMYLSSVAYTIPVEGFITEDVTLVGNSKGYISGSSSTPTEVTAPTSVLKPKAAGRRYHLADTSILPTGTRGGTTTDQRGTIPVSARSTTSRPYLQNINISMDLGREAVFELGKFAPYARYATFPIEVTSEFEVIAETLDGVQAKDFKDEAACSTNIKNLDDLQIKIVICGSGSSNKYTIDLGSKNKLSSVNYSGGDTGGGNATVTYSYSTFNKFKVKSEGTFAQDSAESVTV